MIKVKRELLLMFNAFSLIGIMTWKLWSSDSKFHLGGLKISVLFLSTARQSAWYAQLLGERFILVHGFRGFSQWLAGSKVET